ncbi:MAG TPA: outer membrane beta-barrel protein [Spirochaetota bacterium]|nr:outer membrane beta-barrel protein [Spirochaetota bacterium]
MKIAFALLITVAAYAPCSAGDNIGLAAHMGLHYDVGNLSALPGAQVSPQINIILGARVKTDIRFFFMQLGIEQTFLVSEGEILNDSYGELKKTSIQYLAFPLYGGLNFPVRDRGKFYIGAGGAWIIGTGYLKSTTARKNLREIIFSHGFITGMQIRLTKDFGLYLDLEMLFSDTGPAIDIDPAHDWKNFSPDYSGSRFHCGVFYYVK